MNNSRKLLTNGKASLQTQRRPPLERTRVPIRQEIPTSLRFLLVGAGVVVLLLIVVVIAKHKPHAKRAFADTPAVDRVDSLKECMAYVEPGNPYETSDPDADAAFQNCQDAAATAPHSADFLYQEGASALFSGHTEEASTSFQEAADAGSCPALYFLGRLSWHDKHDVNAAEALFKRAANCGDSRAQKELFNPDDYKSSAYPTYMAALYNSDVATLNRIRFLSASYVSGFYEVFSEQYNGVTFDPCWSKTYFRGGDISFALKAAEKGDASNFIESHIYEQSLPLIYRVVLPSQGSEALSETRETARLAGKGDALRMINSSHCGALLPSKVMQGVETFAKAKKSLFATARELYPQVHSISDLQDVVSQSQNSVRSEQ